MRIQAQLKPILLGNCKRMLVELHEVFNEISAAINKNVWSFKYVQHGTNILLSHLNELRAIHKRQIDILTNHQS